MKQKAILKDWISDALTARGGSGRVLDVCKYIWQHHESDLRAMGDLFFTWQYDVRWAAQELRNSGQLRAVAGKRNAVWELT